MAIALAVTFVLGVGLGAGTQGSDEPKASEAPASSSTPVGQMSELESRVADLLAENADLRAANKDTQSENSVLRDANGRVETKNAAFESAVDSMRVRNARLEADLASTRSQLRSARSELARLESKRPAPRLVGSTLSAVQATATEEGWTLKVEHRASSMPAGSVLSQTPAPGTPIYAGDRVSVVVAKALPPPPPPTSKNPSTSSNNCTPGYSPCLPPASDYDCAGGSGNGPEYVYGTVRVTGSDPYGPDADGDGYGCE